MKKEMLDRIVENAKNNSNIKITTDDVIKMVNDTEQALGTELTGFTAVDKPYNQFYSEEALTGEFPKGKVSEILLNLAKKDRTKIAYRCENDFTNGELIDTTLKYAYILKNKFNIKPGDCVVMDVLSTPKAISAFLAINLVGAKMRPVDPISSPDNVKKVIEDMDAKLFICNNINYSQFKDMTSEMNLPVSYLSLDGYMPFVPKMKKNVIRTMEKINKRKIHSNGSNWFCFEDDLSTIDINDINLDDICSEYVEDEVALVIPTSGTTGEAKGVELTNENLIYNAYKEKIAEFDIEEGDELFNPMPTCSSFFWYMTCLTGFLEVPSSLSPLFDAKQSPKQIANDSSNWSLLGPIIINEICRYIESGEDDSILSEISDFINKHIFNTDKKEIISKLKNKKHLVSGGDLLSLDLYDRATALGLEINDNLGTSENAGPSVFPNGARKNNVGFARGSVGVILPGNEMGIFKYDFDSQMPDINSENYSQGVPYFEVGEMCFRAENPNIFKGYYNNPTATNSTILEHPDGTKWYHTGDFGYLDAAGHIYCKGRKSGLIVRQGHKVWAPKIENIIKSFKGVKDCSVVGTPDSIDKEVPTCFISFYADVNEEEKEKIKSHIYSKIITELDDMHLPKYYYVIDNIPKNLMGKTKVGELEQEAIDRIVTDNNSNITIKKKIFSK